jgi:glycosyltransferase involved in cell wall biosynthesis
MTTSPTPKPNISLFFPVYNDETTVGLVAEKSLRTLRDVAGRFEIVIVNDGSPDRSGAVADEIASRFPEIVVVHHPKNLGYGQALQTGFRTARQFEWVCFLDGDDQYDVRELYHIVAMLDDYDLILSRRDRKVYGPMRVMISSIYNFLVRRLFKVKFRDVSSGFKIARRQVIDDLKITASSAFIGAEIAVRAHRKGYRIGEVGIRMYPRTSGDSSIITVKSILATIRDMIRVWREPAESSAPAEARS